MRHGLDRAREQQIDVAGIEPVQRRGYSPERHMQEIDAGHLLQHLAGKVIAGADAAGAEGVLAWRCFRLGNEVGEIANGVIGAHRHADRYFRDQADRGEVAQRIEGEPGIHRRHHGHRRGGEEEGGAVRRRLHHATQADRAAGAGPVLQDEDALGLRGQPVDQQPRREIDRTAGRVRHDDAHRAGGPVLRQRRRGEECENGGEGAQAGYVNDCFAPAGRDLCLHVIPPSRLRSRPRASIACARS